MANSFNPQSSAENQTPSPQNTTPADGKSAPQYSEYSYVPQYAQAPPAIKSPIAIVPHPRCKSKFLTFICGLIPGAGQMYHGLLKKGVSIMLLFWGTIAISSFLYLPALSFFLPVLWFYSFFDSVNRMSMPIDELKLLKDETIFHAIPKSDNSTINNIVKKRHLIFGWVLTLFGFYAVLNICFNRILFRYYEGDFVDQMYVIWRNLPGIIIPIICVIIGVKLIIGKKVIKQSEAEQ